MALRDETRQRPALATGHERGRLSAMPRAEAEVPREPTAGARDDEAERQRFLDAIAEGIADADAGRVHTHAEVVARMRARFAARSK